MNLFGEQRETKGDKPGNDDGTQRETKLEIMTELHPVEGRQRTELE